MPVSQNYVSAAVGQLRQATILRLNAQRKISAIDRLNPISIRTPLGPPEAMQFLSPRANTQKSCAPLIDKFHRKHDYLRISLAEKCNLRCFYCMPEEGIELSPRAEILSDDEILRLAGLFVQHGVTKIRLTGGEPTVRNGIVDLVGRLNGLRESGLRSIGMTSNGLALHRKLPQLVQNGLTHLNLSLDTLDPAKFESITRRRGHDGVMKSLYLAMTLQSQGQSNLSRVKLNVVVVKDINDAEVLDFVDMTRDHAISVRFIEFMPFSGNKWNKDRLIPSSTLLSTISQLHPAITKCEDEPNDTARSYTIPGFKGRIGFISSMSDHFCHTCNRLRITADGKIKVCLFDGAEISLRDALRGGASDEQLSQVIGTAVGNKQEKHDAMEDIDTVTNRPMILIGGPSRIRVLDRPSRLRGGHLLLPGPRLSSSVRLFSSSAPQPTLTHVDASGRPSMVDVSAKASTKRSATATGRIRLTPDSFYLVFASIAPSSSKILTKQQEKSLSKGPVLVTANLAGIMAAKQTSSLIPLCHQLPLTSISVDFSPEREDGLMGVRCNATVTCDGKTGVEMEALTAVMGALVCVWDMVKAVDGAKMIIEDVMVIQKTGGKSGDWDRGR